jgi:hypothetical protein
VKVQTMRPISDFVGEEVHVPKRSGGSSKVTLGTIVQRWNYANTHVGVFQIAKGDNGNSYANDRPAYALTPSESYGALQSISGDDEIAARKREAEQAIDRLNDALGPNALGHYVLYMP